MINRIALLLFIGLAFSTTINIPSDYATIQGGIDNSEDGDTVLVQPGLYYENINYNQKNIVLGSLFMTMGDTSYISSTIVDGGDSGSVVTISDSTPYNRIELNGLKIRNGNKDNGAGGISINMWQNIEDTVYLKNLIVLNNTHNATTNAFNGGGGIYARSSKIEMDNILIKGNTINLIGDTYYTGGGGIHLYNSTANILNTIIEENSVNRIDDPQITTWYRGRGGGIYSYQSNTVINNSIVRNNSVSNEGFGGGFAIEGNLVANNVIIQNNIAYNGGGISGSEESIFTNCTIYSNSGYNGGGIYGYGTVINSILWSDTPQETYGESVIVVYSNIQGGFQGIGNINSDPLFVDEANGNYNLQSNSPCIDTGTDFFTLLDDTLINLSTNDYYGLAPDMGAFEYQENVDIDEYDFVYDSLSQIPNVDVDAGTLHLFANFYDGTTYPPNPDTGQNFLLLSAFNTSGANVQEEIVDLIDVGDIIRIQNGDGSKVQSFTADTATAFGDERIMVPFNTATFSYVSISGTGFSHNEDVTFINTSATVFIDKELESVMRYTLYPNYPNPFNPVTTLRYDLPEDAMVNITIYDMMGRQVKALVNGSQTAGYKSIQWNATNSLGEPVSAGLYLYTIQAGDYTQTNKMVLLK